MTKTSQNEAENFGKFTIVFDTLEEAKEDQMTASTFSQSSLIEIDESIKALEEIQNSVGTINYTFYTLT